MAELVYAYALGAYSVRIRGSSPLRGTNYMFKQIILPLLAVAGFIVVVGLFSQGKINLPKNSPSPSVKPLNTIKINNVEIPVEVAKTDQQRQKGLSGRTNLADKNGMIFVFQKGSKPTFWMKDTKIPLDIIWIRNGKIVKIDKNVPTEIGKTDTELTRYFSPQAIDYVLEVNAGFSDKNKITVDQSLSGLEQL